MIDKEKIFLEFLNENKLNTENCIRNYKNKRMIFKKEIDGKIYFIKKYIPYGRREKTIAFGLYRDRVNHYEYISKKLDKLGIKYVPVIYSKIKRDSFFKRSSILVTEYGGETLEVYENSYKDNIDLFKEFFDIYIKLYKNGIYCTDYNFGGVLVNDKRELVLIDFDAYKTKLFLTKKFKKRLFFELKTKMNDVRKHKQLEEFCEKELQRVIKELHWGNFKK